MLECVISLETLLFVERHYAEQAEIADLPSLALFLVNCANMALPSTILPLDMFTLHNFPEDMFPHITQKSPRGVHTRPVWGELMVKVKLSLCLIVFVRPGSHL
jgi:hypothetical protein